MVSRKAQRRDSHSSANSDVIHGDVISMWPRYYWLFEHDLKVTVIRIPGPQDQIEVEEMIRRGCAACDHRDKLGPCISVERATLDDWLDTHA